MKSHFAFSVQGESHKRREKESENFSIGKKFPCQDRSCAEELLSENKIKFDFLCVSDGHGGDAYFRSEKGAEFAIQVFKDILRRNMLRISELAEQNQGEKIRNQLALSITKRWREKIQNDLNLNPITEKEFSYLEKANPKAAENYKNGKDLESIYGCTLIGFFATEKFFFALQIGDGDFGVSYDGAKFEFPVPEDENCFFNQTTSLCDDNAANEFRFCIGAQIPKVVFCSSDGVANSFKTKDQFINFYSSVADLFNGAEFLKCQKRECESPQNCNPDCKNELAIEEIKNYLPVLSKKGSGDDVSLVGFVNIDEKVIQAVKDYYRGYMLCKNGGNGQEFKGKKLLACSAKNRNAKAWFRYGEILLSESEREAKISERIIKLKNAYACFEQSKKLNIPESEAEMQKIKNLFSKIGLEKPNYDMKISGLIKDYLKPIKVGFNDKIEKLDNKLSSAIGNISKQSGAQK